MLGQLSNSQRSSHAQSPDSASRTGNEPQVRTDNALELSPANIERRTVLKAIAAGVAAGVGGAVSERPLAGAEARTESAALKADTVLSLGGVSLELRNGLTAKILQQNFGATFIEKDGKPYLQHSGKATPNPVEIGANTLSVQCSVIDKNLHIRLIDKPDASGQQKAQFATIDRFGDISIEKSEIMFNVKNEHYPERSLQITDKEHPELHAALKDLTARGYSFQHTFSGRSADFYTVTDRSGKVVADFKYEFFTSKEDAAMKEWARDMKKLP